MDITYTVSNLVDNNFKDVNFAVLAWDREGFPLKLDEVNYTSNFSIDNLASYAQKDFTHEIATVLDIGYMSMFVSDYTDFDGNYWVNPIMENIAELEGTMVQDTQLSYFTFQ